MTLFVFLTSLYDNQISQLLFLRGLREIMKRDALAIDFLSAEGGERPVGRGKIVPLTKRLGQIDQLRQLLQLHYLHAYAHIIFRRLSKKV